MIFVLKPLPVYKLIRLVESVFNDSYCAIDPLRDIWSCMVHFNAVFKGNETHLSILDVRFGASSIPDCFDTILAIINGKPVPIHDVSLAAELIAWQAENAGKLIRIEQSTEQPV